MATIRLNDFHRSFLNKLALDTVRCPNEEALDKKAYERAAPLVKKLVQERYPVRDMNVLLKYEQAAHDKCIRLQLTAGGVVEFSFRGDKAGPITPGGGDRWSCRNRMYAADDGVTEAVQTSIAAKEAWNKALKAKLGDYSALIKSSLTLEQVEKVWPEASSLRARIANTLPVILSNEVIERIQADATIRRVLPHQEARAA